MLASTLGLKDDGPWKVNVACHLPDTSALMHCERSFRPLCLPSSCWTLLQEARPHIPEAVAVTGCPVVPSQLSQDITLDDVAAALRLEHGEVAAALIKARDSLQEQSRLQQQREAKEAAAAAAAEAAERAKPKVGLKAGQLSGLSSMEHAASLQHSQSALHVWLSL